MRRSTGDSPLAVRHRRLRRPRARGHLLAAALGWRRTHTSADGGEIVLEPPEGSPEDGISPDLVFVRVPDSTPGNNRLRVDLRPTDPAAEVSRLEALGATCVDVGQSARRDASWVAMSDQE